MTSKGRSKSLNNSQTITTTPTVSQNIPSHGHISPTNSYFSLSQQQQQVIDHNNNTPKLVRASSINITDTGILYKYKVTIDFEGDINSTTDNWSKEEVRASRRLVQITSVQNYNHLTLYFKPITQKEYSSKTSVISCIFWEKTGRFYVTCVDLICLLEKLVCSKFPVEEKNRIRRNLQSVRPLTISKSNKQYSEFYGLIMNYNNPKPRHIEKGVKVLYWDHIREAMSKVLSKYTVNTLSDINTSQISYKTELQSQYFNSSDDSESYHGTVSQSDSSYLMRIDLNKNDIQYNNSQQQDKLINSHHVPLLIHPHSLQRNHEQQQQHHQLILQEPQLTQHQHQYDTQQQHQQITGNFNEEYQSYTSDQFVQYPITPLQQTFQENIISRDSLNGMPQIDTTDYNNDFIPQIHSSQPLQFVRTQQQQQYEEGYNGIESNVEYSFVT